jgi:hypothetical protein
VARGERRGKTFLLVVPSPTPPAQALAVTVEVFVNDAGYDQAALSICCSTDWVAAALRASLSSV